MNFRRETKVSLLVAAATLGPPGLELSNGAATPGAKEENCTAIRRSHLAELSTETFIIRIVPTLTSLPW
jgi:hypothetical protein